MINRLVLASSSIFRVKLLRSSGLEFQAISSSCDEEKITDLIPFERAKKRASLKAKSVEGLGEEVSVVIGCDQVVEFEGQPLGKVNTKQEAFDRLLSMQGKAHILHSAYALCLYDKNQKAQILFERVISSVMKMRSLNTTEIESYLGFDEWQGSSGCYQFEGRGIHLFEDVAAEQSAIVGLPLSALMKDLRKIGVDYLLNPSGPWELVQEFA